MDEKKAESIGTVVIKVIQNYEYMMCKTHGYYGDQGDLGLGIIRIIMN